MRRELPERRRCRGPFARLESRVKLVLFTHPQFLPSKSMERFASMLEDGYRKRGFTVEVWAPRKQLRRWVSRGPLSKWAGYVDQFLIFPVHVRRRLRSVSDDNLFIFCDQALGPWVPLVEDFPHVVHCHDLLALRSALGDIPQNPTRWTGRVYQRFIRAGFRRARHFISVSEKSRSDLHEFGGVRPISSEVVYNGLNDIFAPLPADQAREVLHRAGMRPGPGGLILSIGADVWYKNRLGVFRIYEHYVKSTTEPLPMWIVGPEPHADQRRDLDDRIAPGKIHFLGGLDGNTLRATYSLARVLLFPSLAEGFGWPIVEAMACGCPVLTTAEAPMTEVGGDAAHYLPLLQFGEDIDAWASRCAPALAALLALDGEARAATVAAGIAQAARFDADCAIDAYLDIYHRVFAQDGASRSSAQHCARKLAPTIKRAG